MNSITKHLLIDKYNMYNDVLNIVDNYIIQLEFTMKMNKNFKEMNRMREMRGISKPGILIREKVDMIYLIVFFIHNIFGEGLNDIIQNELSSMIEEYLLNDECLDNYLKYKLFFDWDILQFNKININNILHDLYYPIIDNIIKIDIKQYVRKKTFQGIFKKYREFN